MTAYFIIEAVGVFKFGSKLHTNILAVTTGLGFSLIRDHFSGAVCLGRAEVRSTL